MGLYVKGPQTFVPAYPEAIRMQGVLTQEEGGRTVVYLRLHVKRVKRVVDRIAVNLKILWIL